MHACSICSAADQPGKIFDLPAMGDVPSVIDMLTRGLPVSCFKALARVAKVNERDLAGLANISVRTIARRKREGVFPVDEGERVLRLMRVMERTMELFEGNGDAALAWLKTPNPLLEGKPPLDYSRTEPGAQLVHQVIGRLEHGVFS